MSQEEVRSALFEDLTRKQYAEMGSSSSKRIIEEEFPEDESWGSSSSSKSDNQNQSATVKSSEVLPNDLQDASMSGNSFYINLIEESENQQQSIHQRDQKEGKYDLF